MIIGLQFGFIDNWVQTFPHLWYLDKSSYAEDLILLITGKGPALLNDSFLVSQSVMFNPSAYTRSPSLYSTASIWKIHGVSEKILSKREP